MLKDDRGRTDLKRRELSDLPDTVIEVSWSFVAYLYSIVALLRACLL